MILIIELPRIQNGHCYEKYDKVDAEKKKADIMMEDKKIYIFLYIYYTFSADYWIQGFSISCKNMML